MVSVQKLTLTKYNDKIRRNSFKGGQDEVSKGGKGC